MTLANFKFFAVLAMLSEESPSFEELGRYAEMRNLHTHLHRLAIVDVVHVHIDLFFSRRAYGQP